MRPSGQTVFEPCVAFTRSPSRPHDSRSVPLSVNPGPFYGLTPYGPAAACSPTHLPLCTPLPSRAAREFKVRVGGCGTLLTLEFEQSYPQTLRVTQGTLLTHFWDSTDETRGYPGDSTDETNT
jgi:hypothetical protein